MKHAMMSHTIMKHAMMKSAMIKCAMWKHVMWKRAMKKRAMMKLPMIKHKRTKKHREGSLHMYFMKCWIHLLPKKKFLGSIYCHPAASNILFYCLNGPLNKKKLNLNFE